MVAEQHIRGHKTYFDVNTMSWRYKHNHEFVKETDDLECPQCGKKGLDINGVEDCDFCLQSLTTCDFIASACCGHGVKKGYILLKDGRVFEEDVRDD